MSTNQEIIESAWDNRQDLTQHNVPRIKEAVTATLNELDAGQRRVAEYRPDHSGSIHGWVVNQWLKKAVLLYFKLHDNVCMANGPQNNFDKIPLKTLHWTEERFRERGFRMVPTATVRAGAHIAPGVVLMPSFVNIGAFVDTGTMIDTWATVGSCAQIGKNVHISGGTGIGGVLEPLQANPVIIEDDCFIGARAEVAEGVIVGRGAVLSMGVFLSASTRIVNRETGEITQGYVPPYSVVVSGTMPGKPWPNGQPGPNLYCAVIVKTVDAQTRAKTGINELLREF
ncbi:MAG: 2,3,4,5-tetrahydropyridine-2,6-dicarboxylate N-succinyltransferase [Magnetococcales bacterium]|nr:2,3,4,5-tetrahydropyridine-2,6-dicarboxylate N-succinyltransferase [Magnetococcales bacterium]